MGIQKLVQVQEDGRKLAAELMAYRELIAQQKAQKQKEKDATANVF